MSAAQPILEVEGLHVLGPQGPLVRDVSFAIGPGEILGLVGESGSGKTLTARAILGLLPEGLRRTSGTIRFRGEDLSGLDPERRRAIRGAHISLVFQEPSAALNPVLSIGHQIEEMISAHVRMPKAERRDQAIASLERVGLSADHLRSHAHELSGGMAQRALIAIATCLEPELLIADEATTALDTRTQARILDLLCEQRSRHGRSLLLISHDLGVIARAADRVAVMLDGSVVESGPIDQIFERPAHEYTRHLIEVSPHLGAEE